MLLGTSSATLALNIIKHSLIGSRSIVDISLDNSNGIFAFERQEKSGYFFNEGVNVSDINWAYSCSSSDVVLVQTSERYYSVFYQNGK